MLTGYICRGKGIKGIVDIQKKFTVTFKNDADGVLQQIPVTLGGTAVYNGTVPPRFSGDDFYGWVLSKPAQEVIDPDGFSGNIYQQISNVREDITCWAVYSNHKIIHDSWEVISQRSQAGTASNYYNVGDLKRIHLEGTVGTLSVNRDVYVSIMEFDHNSEIEGSGITFGCFNDVDTLYYAAITDSYYGRYSSDGSKYFNMNHRDFSNMGGWRACNLRNDILGSSDAENPRSNTLMSCLPADLRAVMKPITKYTDNMANNSNSSSNVTATTDYLPLISEYELLGNRTNANAANAYERNKQVQYEIFSRGIGAVKNILFTTRYVCSWWLRSPCKNSNSDFCLVGTDGLSGNIQHSLLGYSYGLCPVLLV